MSTLRTFNLQNPDSGTVNIEMDQGGNTLMTGIATVRGAAHFTSTSGSDAVGIGTDITAYKLDVRVTGAEAGLRVYNPDTSSNASGILRLGNDDNQNAAFLRLNGSNNTSAVGGAGSLVLGHGLSKNLHLSTAGASRFAVRSDGKISAGTLLDTNNSYEFSIRGADGTGCLYAHGRNHYLSTRSTSHSSLTLKKSNSDSDGVDYLQLRDSSNAAKLIINGDGTLQVLDTINHMGDTDTKIRFPAGDTFTVETAGAENARFTSSAITFKAPDGGSRYLFGEMGNSASAELSLYNSSDAQKVRIAANNATFFNGGFMGLGTNAPAMPLDVHGADTNANGLGDVKGQLRIFNDTTAFGSSPRAGVVFSTKYRTSPDVPLDGAAIYGGKQNGSDAHKDFFLAFATRSESPNEAVERMRIDSNGIVTKPYQPSFYVSGSFSITSWNSNKHVNWVDATTPPLFDTNNDYANGVFTAPVDGKYYFSASFLTGSNAGFLLWAFYKNTSKYQAGWFQVYDDSVHSNNECQLTGSIIMDMSAGDTARVAMNNTHDNVYTTSYNYFLGYLIG